MSLQAKIADDLKAAMRAGETMRRDTLRMLIAAFKNRRIEKGADLDADEELAVVAKSVKSRIEAAEQYGPAGRPELEAKERAEAEVLAVYLPQGLTEDETRAEVQALIDELGLSGKAQMGQLMKAVMAKHKGRVDGKLVSRLAGELLG